MTEWACVRAGLWKLLTGDVQQDVYMGPHYPNSSTNEVSNNFVGHCANGCLYELRSDPLEAHDVCVLRYVLACVYLCAHVGVCVGGFDCGASI